MISNSSWRPSWGAPALPANEVHVWRATLDLDPAGLDCLEKTLAPNERARAAGFRFSRDREQFVSGRGILRDILARYLGREPEELRFGCGPCGKPFLLRNSAGPELHFNLAHSYGLALYAIARNRKVGVDLERIHAGLADQQVAERFFSRRESSALRTLEESLRVEAFFNCWTRKEAYVKARGEGLLVRLDSFDVTLTPGRPAELLGGDGGWSVHALTPLPGYAAAVVVEGSNCDPRLWTWRAMMMGPSCAIGPHNRRNERKADSANHCFWPAKDNHGAVVISQPEAASCVQERQHSLK